MASRKSYAYCLGSRTSEYDSYRLRRIPARRQYVSSLHDKWLVERNAMPLTARASTPRLGCESTGFELAVENKPFGGRRRLLEVWAPRLDKEQQHSDLAVNWKGGTNYD
jgi:hypothetical protein